MIFNDGECPICKTTRLHLNTYDLMECRKCNLMLSLADPLYGMVLKSRGKGLFRFEDCDIANKNSRLLTKSSQDCEVLPDYEFNFNSIEEIESYLNPRTKNDSDIALDLWHDFVDALKTSLKYFNSDELKEFWSSKPSRTAFYRNKLMPEIAGKLKLIHGEEEFKVDYVMSKPTYGGFDVPQIFIESENEIGTASHEIRKLSSLNSPLRVLFTVFDNWTNENDLQIYRYLRDWQTIISEHWRLNSYGASGIIGIAIGSKIDGAIKFSSFAFWDNGDIRQPLDVLCRCAL